MSVYKCCCDNDDNQVLSEEVEKFIENKLGEELVFIVAFGINGTALPLRSKSVESRKIDFDNQTIKTTEITNIKAAALTSYVGSHKCTWTFGGTHEEFTHRD